ncbi:hypothetical protein K438DRAFT_1969697 [Mycena galopus ATCC 62051]|nr:hypothetical protein K438DRAFT_1969697 [Mycena galopus ATCC 62051]
MLASPSPLLPSLLSTSVSSPAWFPPFASPLMSSLSSATLVEQSPPSKSSSSSKLPPIVHQILEDGEIAQAQVLMKDLTLGLGLTLDVTAGNAVDVAVSDDSTVSKQPGPHLGPGQIDESPSPPSPSPTPPRAPSVGTIPLPPADAPSAYPPPAPIPIPSTPATVPVAVAIAASVPAPVSPPASTPARAPSPLPAPAPAVHEPQTQTAHAQTQPQPHTDKTPNVYINGLPPNFPEDQLFALASPFGAVRSVRSFTRHVGDAETGYGFVLFDSIAAAEKCINSLRRYRNLHPTFSKVHKIPGTMYSQPAAAASPFDSNPNSNADGSSVHLNADLDANTHTNPDNASASSLAGWEQESAGTGSADSGFKAKMARLADNGSTNLYVEGLPLSIDEATLAALVSPYAIRSSRFFQTKLSSPPRIIAFVRLETRAAAEEIIERLHGRMVRGWNDPGSRISVRFADTSEQRELRRTERLAREGDQASSQLSIAQATLLNLRGKDLHAHASANAHPHAHSQPIERADHASEFEVDYSRVPPAFNLQPQHMTQRMNMNMDPEMASLLESLQASSRRERELYGGVDYDDYLEQQQHQLAPPHPLSSTMTHPYARGLGLAGATATEEFILRARANSLPQAQNGNMGLNVKRRPVPLDLGTRHRQMGGEMDDSAAANIGMGVRGYRAHAATLAFPHHQPHGMLDSMNMDEEEFHAAASIPHQLHGQHQHQQPRQAQFDAHGARTIPQQPGVHAHAHSLQHTNNARISRTQQQSQSQPLSSLRGPSGTHDFIRTHPNNVNLNNSQQTHHYQNARNMNPNLNLRPAHVNNTNTNNSMMHTNTSSLGNSNSNHGIYERTNNNNAREMRGMNRHNGTNAGYNNGGPHSHHHSHSHSHVYSTQQQHDGDQSSPPLVSPALTYSSRSSAAGFSPTTPFFGSFDEDETTFRVDGIGKSKKNSRTSTR